MSVDHTKNVVEVCDVSFAYDRQLVLKNVNLNIHQGDYLGIVGPNGGGKSTLLKLILGLLTPTQGKIVVKAQKIGYVAQKVTNFDRNFPLTVAEVVALGKTTPETVDWAIGQVEMQDFRTRRIGDLSGGQQQRVFIARALAQKPDLLFLDEPTAGVDAASQKLFYALLKKLNRELDLTLVMVSHDVDVLVSEVMELACINETVTYYGDPHKFVKHHHD